MSGTIRALPTALPPEKIGIRQFRADVSELIETCQDRPVIITRHGIAEAVLISVQDFLEHYVKVCTHPEV